jgi:hypothetical protein
MTSVANRILSNIAGIQVVRSSKMRKELDRQKRIEGLLRSFLDRELYELIAERQRHHSNPFVRYGKKCFSQSDEDGITIEILNRLELSRGKFVEFGVGNGMENNTLILLSLGWHGVWIGGEDLAFDVPEEGRLSFKKCWVTKANVMEFYQSCAQKKGVDDIDLISVDLDGNDYHVCHELLSHGVKPKVFIVEYNAKFPPPVEFIIDYNPNQTWRGDDYFGASLKSFDLLFRQYNYNLICCNAATGANAFFVQREYLEKFPEVPKTLEQIYVDPFYFLLAKHGHAQSIEVIKKVIR